MAIEPAADGANHAGHVSAAGRSGARASVALAAVSSRPRPSRYRLEVYAEPSTTMGTMTSNAAMRKPKQVSELERARSLGLVGAVKGGPRDVAERHSQYLGAKLRRRARRTR